jgi:hypothetical protein
MTWAPTWDEPELVIDGVVHTADQTYLEANFGPEPTADGEPRPRRSPRLVEPSERFLSADDIAKRLGVSRSRAFEIMRDMSRLKIGRSVRVSVEALAAWERRVTIGPGCGSTSAARPIGASSTANASRSRRRTVKRPSVPSGTSNAAPLIRPIVPRTRRRSA